MDLLFFGTVQVRESYGVLNTAEVDMSMSGDAEPFGARLYAELRKLSGYSVISEMLDYKAIQQLKQADRDMTSAIFARSSAEVLQRLSANEPEDVARYLVDNAYRATVEKATRATNDGNPLLMITLLNSQ